MDSVTSGLMARSLPSRSVKVTTCASDRNRWYCWYSAYSSNREQRYFRQPACSYSARSVKVARSAAE